MCDVEMVELIEPAPNLEARVAALEKLVGVTKAPEYSFGDRVEVLCDGGWVEGLIAAPKDGEDGERWCEYLDDTSKDGASGAWFSHEEIRPRQ